jgi:hypothetical protein
LEVEVAEAYQSRQTQLRQTIEALEKEVATLKQKRQEVPSHLTLGELPPAERFQQFSRAKKHLVDPIKMVAYRAETALAMSLRQHLARTDDARALLREIFVSAADLCPDETAGTLTISLHHLSNAGSDQLAAKMAEELNATETIFPGTQLQMVFKLVSDGSLLDCQKTTPGFAGSSRRAPSMTRWTSRTLRKLLTQWPGTS